MYLSNMIIMNYSCCILMISYLLSIYYFLNLKNEFWVQLRTERERETERQRERQRETERQREAGREKEREIYKVSEKKRGSCGRDINKDR